jgi:hypothetical protein
MEVFLLLIGELIPCTRNNLVVKVWFNNKKSNFDHINAWNFCLNNSFQS